MALADDLKSVNAVEAFVVRKSLMVQEYHLRLGRIIVELYQALALQKYARPVDALSEAETEEIAEWAGEVLEDWHECHEFEVRLFENPVLIRTLLVMYSDAISTCHAAMAAPAGTEGGAEQPIQREPGLNHQHSRLLTAAGFSVCCIIDFDLE